MLGSMLMCIARLLVFGRAAFEVLFVGEFARLMPFAGAEKDQKDGRRNERSFAK